MSNQDWGEDIGTSYDYEGRGLDTAYGYCVYIGHRGWGILVGHFPTLIYYDDIL